MRQQAEKARDNRPLVFLYKGSRLYCQEQASLKEGSANSQYVVEEGYVLKRTLPADPESSSGKLSRVAEHFMEVFHLYRQIGFRNLLRYIHYLKQPRPLYVDGLKVVSPESGDEMTLLSEYPLLLSTTLSKEVQSQLGYREEPFQPDQIARTYVIDRILPTCVSLKRDTGSEEGSLNGRVKERAAPTEGKEVQWLVAGAGAYCASILLPSVLNAGGRVLGTCSNSRVRGEALAKAYSIKHVYNTYQEMLDSHLTENLLIATPHYLHPEHISKAVENQYKIYCEKPVAVDPKGLQALQVHELYANCMIGFNRRFAPAVRCLSRNPVYRASPGPKLITYCVNYGPQYNPSMSDAKMGGGTTVGACCHYLDLIEYLTQSTIKDFEIRGLSASDDIVQRENFSCILSLEDGSLATLVFSRMGKRSQDVKERIIITGKDLNVVVNDFSEVVINGRKRRFFRDHYGARGAIEHFHRTTPLSSSPATPTLKDGIHIGRLTVAMDQALPELRWRK